MMKIKDFCMKVLAGAILLGFFAGWMMFFGMMYELRQMEKVKSWPPRRATITHSYVKSVRGLPNRLSTQFEIAGKYADTGEKFGARVGYGIENSPWTRIRAEKIVARYPVGTEMDVYPQPGKPTSAVLVNQNSTRLTWIALWIALGFGLLPFLLYFYGRLTGYKPPACQ